MKIALAQINIIFEDKHSNYVTVEEFVHQAKENETDLIIFPEMTCLGFTMNLALAEKNEETLAFMKNLSKKYQIKICFGQTILNHDLYYNNLMIIDGDEELLSYNKMHLFQQENDYYQQGSTINYCYLKQIPVSAFICYDLRFPEIFQYASTKAKLIIVIASWPAIRDDHWLSLLKARAIENQCFIIGVNRVGKDDVHEYLGHSVAFDSNGQLLTSLSTEEENIYVEINKDVLDRTLKTFNTKKDRRNDLYLDLYHKI